ncbi:AP-1-like transcription factor, partial [Phenoliferia sp. Uapishka_3]
MAPKVALKPLAGPSSIASISRQEAPAIIRTTKEWIIPPRPKPGRKPAQVDPESSRKALNRASQRAFRERRQEYVVELEELLTIITLLIITLLHVQKVRLLEQGEGEKSVFFQQQAQTAKQETAGLRVENAALRHIVDELRTEIQELRRVCGGGAVVTGGGKGKGKVEREPPHRDAEDVGPAAKRLRRSVARPAAVVPPTSYVEQSSDESDLDDISPSVAVSPIEDQGESPSEPCCGLCSADGSCFCAEVGYKIDRNTTTQAPSRRVVQVEVVADFETSQVAVPLRLRKTPGRTPVWRMEPSSMSSEKPALCNGDPSTCQACQDDPFGKAFCNALSESVCSSNPCTSCPSKHPSTAVPIPIVTSQAPTPPHESSMTDQSLFDALADLPCCGDPVLCGSLTCAPKKTPVSNAREEDVILPRSVEPGVRTVDTVPCNEAWTVLKCHPNIAFADLQMLADVVAKRTHCDGPVSMSLPSSSSSLLPSPTVSPRSLTPPLGLPRIAEEDFQVPSLVPHETLVCATDAGQRRRLTVERGAVNEALQYLDKAFGRGGPSRR